MKLIFQSSKKSLLSCFSKDYKYLLEKLYHCIFSHLPRALIYRSLCICKQCGLTCFEDECHDDQRHHKDTSENPNQHIRWVEHWWLDGDWFRLWLKGLNIVAWCGAVETVSALVNDKHDVLRDFVSCGVDCTNIHCMLAWLKVSSWELHVPHLLLFSMSRVLNYS